MNSVADIFGLANASCEECLNLNAEINRCPYYLNGFAAPTRPCSAFAKRTKPNKRKEVLNIMADLVKGNEDVIKTFQEFVGKEQTEKIIEKIKRS